MLAQATPFDAGYTLGYALAQLFAIGCCLVLVLAVIVAGVWGIVRLIQKRG